MNEQLRAISWAQFRTIRNFLPRTSAGTILLWIVSLFWYGAFVIAALSLAINLPGVPLPLLNIALPTGLLCVLLFWQIFPLMTLSGGWSLDLTKLLVYPIPPQTLFLVEVLLRITTAPEMIIILAGTVIGLMRHPFIAVLKPLWLVLYLPLNLFLSLGLREWLVRMFERRRLREIVVILFLCISVLPSLLVNTPLGPRLKPVFLRTAQTGGMPWFDLSGLTLRTFKPTALGITMLWLGASYLFARRQFAKVLEADQSQFPAALDARKPLGGRARWSEGLFRLPGRFLSDPLAALIEKELRILTRSPRFRVIFGMACFFSLVVFFPFSSGRLSGGFLSENYLPAVSAYGLLILGEVLLWNTFGFDRKAAQLYFVAPVPFRTVLLAKNAVALALIALMTFVIAGAGALIHSKTSPDAIAGSILLTFVLSLFFLAFGNVTSVTIPRPVDPNQAFRRQNSARSSLWLLFSLAVLLVPIGLAFAARWAFESAWPFFAVLGVDLVVGAITYFVATDSAIARAEHQRELLLDQLARGTGPIG